MNDARLHEIWKRGLYSGDATPPYEVLRYAHEVVHETVKEVLGIIGERTIIDPTNTDADCKAANRALAYVERRVRGISSIPAFGLGTGSLPQSESNPGGYRPRPTP